MNSPLPPYLLRCLSAAALHSSVACLHRLFHHQLAPGQAVEGSLTGVSVPFLIRAFGIPAFDFLKIDIEGSEGDFFKEGEGAGEGEGEGEGERHRHNLEWVDAAKLVALELHGDMVPGSNVTVLNYFARKDNFVHQKDWSGEYEVFLRKNSDLEP